MNSPVAHVRQAAPEDAEPLLRVLCAAFHIDLEGARPLFYRDPFFDLSHKRVLLDSHQEIVSCLTVIPSDLRIGGVVIPTAGIAGVATHPEHQRRGHAGVLLSETVRSVFAELSYPIAALFPYSYDFYRRFGWETASRAWLWAGPTACLPSYREAVCVRPSGPGHRDDRPGIHRLHEAATRGRTGAFRRGRRRWEVIELLTPARHAAVYEETPGNLEGYVFFEQRLGDGAPTLVVHEMCATSGAARRGLIGFLAGMSQRTPRLEWEAASEDMNAFGLDALPFPDSQRPRATLKPGMMLRLLDLPAALSLLHVERYAPALAHTDASLTLRARDRLCPQNERPFRLHKSGVYEGRLADKDWIAASIGVFAQLYIGFQSPSQAASLGLLTASSPSALGLADRLFPTCLPFAAPADQF